MGSEKPVQEASSTDVFNLLKGFMQQSTNSTEEIKAEIKSLRAEISNKIETLEKENSDLRKENDILRGRLLDTERRQKKYNLVFYGIEEKEEDAHRDYKVILDLLNTKLKIDCRFEELRDTYRVGKIIEGKTRPVIVECLTYPLKAAIIEKRRELKGTGIFVTKDYIPEDYKDQKILRNHLDLARQKNQRAYIKGNSLMIEGEAYTVSQLEAVQEEEEKEEETEEPIDARKTNTDPTKRPVQKKKDGTEGTSTKKRKNSENTQEGQVKRSNRLKRT